MEETRYGLKVSLPCGYDQAVARATDALKSQGFGVLTTIDVKQTLKTKLDRDFRRYLIFGACNPPLAYRALEAELEVGLLLPCNVIVYETGPSTSVVAAMAPRRTGNRRRERSLGRRRARGRRPPPWSACIARISERGPRPRRAGT